jgi:energy-coupling factor transport system ATP-binding protein
VTETEKVREAAAVMISSSPKSLEFQGWGYRHASRRSFVAHNLNLSIPAGQHVLLLGASGIGKSTILAAAAGLIGASESGAQDEEGGQSEGKVLVGGVPARDARGNCALMLQDPDSQAVLQRVGDNVAFGLENIGTPSDAIWPMVRAGLAEVGLADLELHRSTSHLSGGQMQRLALAGAVVMQPGVLLLDEPTANLDPEGATHVVAAVRKRLREVNSTMVVVEHRAQLWMDIIDRVVILGHAHGNVDTDSVDSDGIAETVVVADGTPDEIFTSSLDFNKLGVWVPPQYAAGKAQRHEIEPSSESRATHRSGEVLLSTDQLSIGRNSTAIAEKISVSFRAGEITALVGMNGAGKSTLALTLAGLLPPIAGKVTASPSLVKGTNEKGVNGAGVVNDAGASSGTRRAESSEDPARGSVQDHEHAKPTSDDPQKWSSRQLARRISYVFQNPEHQFAKGSVLQEVMLGPERTGASKEKAEKKGRELLCHFGLERYAQANPYTLSGGEKRRLTVAAALASAPGVIILDEPTFGQDRRTWSEIVELIRDLAMRGVAVIVVTHDEDLVAALHARVLRLGTGAQSDIRVTPLSDRVEESKPASRSRLLATINPAIRLIGAFLATIPLLFSLDLVSAGVTLALEFVILAILGIRPWRVIRSAWPVFIGAPGSALAVLLYGKAGGALLLEWGMVHITERSAQLAGATALRVLAIGIPAILLMLGIDMTDLADAFSQVLKLPDRFVYGGLAGMRLFSVIQDDWRALTASRRSRGLGDDFVVARFFPQAFALLVLSIRRSTSLATAMEARGFGGVSVRSHARESRVHPRDYVFMVSCLAVPLFGLAIAAGCGSLAFFGDSSITT